MVIAILLKLVHILIYKLNISFPKNKPLDPPRIHLKQKTIEKPISYILEPSFKVSISEKKSFVNCLYYFRIIVFLFCPNPFFVHFPWKKE